MIDGWKLNLFKDCRDNFIMEGNADYHQDTRNKFNVYFIR